MFLSDDTYIMRKIAFLFLTHKGLLCDDLWKGFFRDEYKDRFSIYCHPKFPDQVEGLLKPHIVPKLIETKWGRPSCFQAEYNMFEEAFKDKDNQFFIVLSHNCAPVLSFNVLYDKLINRTQGFVSHNKLNEYGYFFHYQWTIVPRPFVELLLKYHDEVFILYNEHIKNVLANNDKVHHYYINGELIVKPYLEESWVSYVLKIAQVPFKTYFSVRKTHYIVFISASKSYDNPIYRDYYTRNYDEKFIEVMKINIVPTIFKLQDFKKARFHLAKDGFFFCRKVEDF